MLDFIVLKALQLHLKIVFILDSRTYNLYYMYFMRVLDDGTGFYQILPTTKTYVARSDDSLFHKSI